MLSKTITATASHQSEGVKSSVLSSELQLIKNTEVAESGAKGWDNLLHELHWNHSVVILTLEKVSHNQYKNIQIPLQKSKLFNHFFNCFDFRDSIGYH
jgi:hypothetical protein